MDNPSVVVGHLSDEEIKKSIESIVATVDDGARRMAQKFDEQIVAMENSFKRLGNLKVDFGSANGNSSKRNATVIDQQTTAIKRQSQAVKDLTYDQQALAQQKAIGSNANIFSTIDIQIQLTKERLTEAQQQMEAFRQMAAHASTTGDKGFFTFATSNFHQYESQVASLSQQVHNLTQQRAALKEMLSPQGDGFKNYVDSLTKINPELAALNDQYKRGVSLLQTQRGAIDSITSSHEKSTQTEQQRVAELQKAYELELKERDEQAKSYDIQREKTRQLEMENAKTAENLAFQERINAARQAKEGGEGKRVRETNELTGAIAGLLGIQEKEVAVTNIESASQHRLANYLNQLKTAYQRLDKEGMSSSHGKMLADEIQRVSRAYAELTKQMNRPTSLKNALGLDETTLDNIAYKIQQLNAYKMGLKITDPKQLNEMKQVDEAVARLKKDYDDLMGKNSQLMSSNNALARSWNYMKNRLAFYFTVGASTQFVKNLIEVRSQYEMNERTLGVLIDSAEKGTQIFNELSQMALVSPYTLIELSNAARQLTAYDVAARDVVDTTRRMADISAAVGVPMERLTYALGQIKAYGYLNNRDARMFLNAGIPLVKSLADHYTKLEGRMVSVGDVYDRIKKKAVDYNEVMQVITEMTDEGGRFFDFQAKMAETLKVQLANLTLAWNNMLNDIGKSEQGILTGGIKTLREFFLNWQSIEKVLLDVVVVLGFAKASQLLLNAAFGKGTMLAIKEQVAQKTLTASYVKNILAKQNLTKAQAKWLVAANKGNIAIEAGVVKLGVLTTEEAYAAAATSKLGMAWKAFAMTISTATQAIETAMAALSAIAPQLILFAAISAIVDVIQTVMDRNAVLEEFNKTLVRNAEEHAKAIREILDSYSSGFDATTLPIDEQKKHWDSLREAIELNSAAANDFIQVLLQEDDMGKRVNMAKELLDKIEQAHELMSLWGEDALDITQDFKVLGIGADGLTEDAKDFGAAMSKAGGAVENLAEASEGIKGTWATILSYVHDFTQMQTWGGYNPTKYINPLYYFDQKLFDESDHNKNKLISTYKELVDEVEPLAESLMKKITDDQISDEKEIKEIISQTIKDLAEEKGWSDQVALSARILLEQKFRESSNKIFQLSVEDRQASWDMWMKYLMARHKTVFQNMGNEEISTEQWAQDSRKKLYEKTFEDFKKVNILAYNDIKDKVDDLNQMQVHIKVFYDEQKQPSWLEQDFKKRLPNSTLNVSAYGNISELIDGERKALKESNEELQNLMRAGVSAVSEGEAGKHYLDVKMRADQATEALNAYNASLEKETKGNKGSKKDVLGDALTKEIQLISDIQKRFVEYKKMGVDAQTAITLATDEYGKSMQRNNAVLQKYGIKAIATKKLTTMPLQQIRDYYQEQLELAERLGNTKGVEALEKAIAGLNVEISKLDYKKIVDDLNSELGKLKEDYELAIELDANPELGGMFAKMFRIDPSDFPKTIDEYMQRVQDEFDKGREKFNYQTPLNVFKATESDWIRWGASVGIVTAKLDEQGNIMADDTTALDKFKAKFVEAQGVAKKWAENTVKETENLQHKLADTDGKIAIENEKLQRLILQREKSTNEEERKLLDLKIKDQTETIARLGDEVLQMLPTYKSLFNSIADHSAYVTRKIAEQWKEALENAKKNADGTYTITDPNGGTATIGSKEYGKQVDKVNKEFRKTASTMAKIKEAFTKGEDGEVDFAKGLEYVAQEARKAASGIKTIAEIVGFLGGEGAEESVEVLNDIATSMEGVSTAMEGYAKIQSGDVIGGAVDMIKGTWSAVSTWLDNGNKKIDREIKKSENAVKDLELAYKNLERAVEKAYGTAVIGAQKVAIANKEAQLAEVKRQLKLEESRDSKHRDENRIRELRAEIIDLENEIADKTEQIVNDLLGISSVGDAMESLMDGFVEALRSGEDAMKVFDESVDDMIANMVKKMFTTKILTPWFEQQWETIQQEIDKRGKEKAKDIAFLKEKASSFSLTGDRDVFVDVENDELAKRVRDQLVKNGVSFKQWGGRWANEGDVRQAYEDLIREANNSLIQATTPTAEDIERFAELLRSGQPILEGSIDEIEELLVRLGLTKDSANKNLSALQQGIQGVTENTAGAIEAYMNSVSQQVYLHSDLLVQIRDAVVAMDSDAQLGVQAQMLLQLQQSYAIQVAIKGILAGWSNPSGLAVRVEMV